MKRPSPTGAKPGSTKHPSGKNNTLLIVGAIPVAVLAVVVGTAWLQAGNTKSIRLSEVSHIHGIAVDANDPLRLFLATHRGLYRTSPDGTAIRVSDNQDDYMGFTVHPSDAGLLYASGHPASGGNMGVMVSRDGGQSWMKLSPGMRVPVDFHAMTISRADPNVLYGVFGSIQVSRDEGRSWTTAGLEPADTIDLAASAASPDIIYAATVKGLMISRDGARTWEPTGEQGRAATMVETTPDGTVYAFVIGAGLIKAPGSALSWSPLSNDFGGRVLLHLAADPADPKRLYAVTDEDKVLSSTDGGRTWAPIA